MLSFVWVCAKAYSSSANLGPGYDVLALAHDAYYDVVCVRKSDRTFVSKVTGEWAVPKENNNAISAINKAKELLESDVDVEIWVHKGVPPGRGLGSSGATAAAAVKAYELLVGKSLAPSDAVLAAAEGERAASGAAHADNVAASYLGGLVAVTYDPFIVVKFGMPKVKLVVAIPWIETPEGKTGLARKLLPENVSLRDAVKMIGGSAMVINALMNGDLDLLGKAVEMDPVVTPARAKTVPCFEAVRSAAREAGAKGVTISGAGPTLLIVGDERAGEAAVEAWKECGVEASFKLVSPAPGASACPPPSL